MNYNKQTIIDYFDKDNSIVQELYTKNKLPEHQEFGMIHTV